VLMIYICVIVPISVSACVCVIVSHQASVSDSNMSRVGMVKLGEDLRGSEKKVLAVQEQLQV
jgi:hypothetical protein